MKRQREIQLGDAIRQFMRQEGIESPYNEFRLVQAWPEVMGQAVQRYTGNIYIKNQVLYVHLTSSVLRQELFMGRQLLVHRLNNYVGAQAITKIVFI